MKRIFTICSLFLLLLLSVSPVSAALYSDEVLKTEILQKYWLDQYAETYPYIVVIKREGANDYFECVMSESIPYIDSYGDLHVYNYLEGSVGSLNGKYELKNTTSGTGSFTFDMTPATYDRSFYYTSTDLLDETGTLVFAYDKSFFPLTPPLQKAVETALENLTVTTVGSMALLTICGIGLMSLMVSLIVLKRVFRMLSA